MCSVRLSAPVTLSKVRVAAPTAEELVTGQSLVRLEPGGLCGSDYSYFKGAHLDLVRTTDSSSYGATLHGACLHEIVGEVRASRDPAIEVGMRVGWATALNGLAE